MALILDTIRILITLSKPGGTKKLISEVQLLRRQLRALKRDQHIRKSPRLTFFDRLILAILAHFIPKKRLLMSTILIRPATILNFHRALVKRKYHILFSNKIKKKTGPKGPPKELIELVISLKLKNTHLGSPQIANFINNNFEFKTCASTVKRILKNHFKNCPGKGPSWLSFIGHSKDSLWSLDFFRVESILLKSHWVMVIMDQYSRKIIGIAIHKGAMSGPGICLMFRKVLATHSSLPKYLSTDHDPLFNFSQWERNLRIYEIDWIQSIPHTPWSHPFIESLIGTIRYEFTSQTLFWNEKDLERKLNDYVKYYNQYRVHSSIGCQPPLEFTNDKKKMKLKDGQYRWKKLCHGLFQVPIAA